MQRPSEPSTPAFDTLAQAICHILATRDISGVSLPLAPIRSRCGDRLLEIMDVDGPWRLELDAPEFRMGHLHQAVIARSTSPPTQPAREAHQTLLPTEQLDVDYIVATAVTKTLHGTLSEIGTRTNESQKAGSTVVELYVDIHPDDLPGRHIGAEVAAKIHCGKMSLGYVLFGDVWEFVVGKLWW